MNPPPPLCELCADPIEPCVGNPVAYPDHPRYRHLAFHSVCLRKRIQNAEAIPWGSRMLLWPRLLTTESQKQALIDLYKYCTRLQVRPGTVAQIGKMTHRDEVMIRIEDKSYRLLFSAQAEANFLERLQWQRRRRVERDDTLHGRLDDRPALLPDGDTIRVGQRFQLIIQEPQVPEPAPPEFEDQDALSAAVNRLEGPAYRPAPDSYQLTLEPRDPPIKHLLARALDLMERQEGATEQLVRFFWRLRRNQYPIGLYESIRRRILLHQFTCPFPSVWAGYDGDDEDGDSAPSCHFPLTKVCPFYHHSEGDQPDLIGEDLRQARPTFPAFICLREALFGYGVLKRCNPSGYFIKETVDSVVRCLAGYHCAKVEDLEQLDQFTGKILGQLSLSASVAALNNANCVSCGRGGSSNPGGNQDQDFLANVWINQPQCHHAFHALCFRAYAQTFPQVGRVPCPDEQCRLRLQQQQHDDDDDDDLPDGAYDWNSWHHCILWPEPSICFQSEHQQREVFDLIDSWWHVRLTNPSVRIEEVEEDTEPETGSTARRRLFRISCSNGQIKLIDYADAVPQYIRMFAH